MPQKAAVLRVLIAKTRFLPDSQYVSKMTITKMLFEGQVGHIGEYIPDYTYSLIESGSEGFKIKDVNQFPKGLNKMRSYNALADAINSWEKSIPRRNPAYNERISSIENFIEIGLDMLVSKFEEFFNGLTSNQLEEITSAIRDRKFGRSILSSFPKGDITRLILDAIMYSTYCLVLGIQMNNFKMFNERYRIEEFRGEEDKRVKSLNERNVRIISIVTRIVDFLSKSQGKDGLWALWNYDEGLKLKDTSAIFFLLNEIRKVGIPINIDENKARSAKSYISGKFALIDADDEPFVKLEHQYLRQTDLYTTVQTIAGLHSIQSLLNEKIKEVFENELVARFFQYLNKFQKDGGFGLKSNGSPDIETTSFIINVLVGKNSFSLSESILNEKLHLNLRLSKSISYFYRNMKVLEDYVNKGYQLNVACDYILALLWCKVWPCSSYLLTRLKEACEGAKKDLHDFKDVDIFAKLSNRKIGFSPILALKYSQTMASVHVLHHAILCTNIIYNYLDQPDSYWNDIKPLLA